MARPPAESSKTPWLLIGGGLLALGMILFLLDRQLAGVGEGDADATGPRLPPAPIQPEALDPATVVRVRLVPIARDGDGHPRIEVRLRDMAWKVAYPDPALGMVQTSKTWNALLPACERYCDDFAEAIRRIREAEPKRTVGLVEVRAQSLPDTVVNLVRDAMGDGGITRSVVVDGGSWTGNPK